MPYALPVSAERPSMHIEVLGELLGPEELRCWRFHGARFFVTMADRVTEVLMEAARRGTTIYDRPIAAGRAA